MARFELQAEGQRWHCEAKTASGALGIFGLQLNLLFTYHERKGSVRYTLGAPPESADAPSDRPATIVWGTSIAQRAG
jgi:hypothetical protein